MKRLEIRLDEETEKDLRYLADVLGSDMSKTVKALIRVTAMAIRKAHGCVKAELEEKK